MNKIYLYTFTNGSRKFIKNEKLVHTLSAYTFKKLLYTATKGSLVRKQNAPFKNVKETSWQVTQKFFYLD